MRRLSSAKTLAPLAPAPLLDSPASKIKHNQIPLPCSISVNKAVVSGSVSSYALESRLGNCGQATAICRATMQRLPGRSLEGLTVQGFDYDSILGQCCEMPIGFVQILVEVALCSAHCTVAVLLGGSSQVRFLVVGFRVLVFAAAVKMNNNGVGVIVWHELGLGGGFGWSGEMSMVVGRGGKMVGGKTMVATPLTA
ncbi:3-hydroxy-3-methylglutaryl-coenzyme A reductase [Vigna angularis]|uniref:3-hydroxy-3-methylglutaryl-coenzyme A reductase n=1 Tax=Phaseolus angularis TaxID=3914 RepID=A0A8T0JSE5_PHAAN|nr:3-hydroxy-3-methylglutaryl-coenzyme A reductase [Vigna angularis]